MNTSELAADYICKDQERLRMALHVYEAMPDVRKYLIKEIFEAVGDRIRQAKDLADDGLECYDESVYFCTEESGDFWVYAALEHGKRGVLWLYVGVHHDDAKSVKAQRDEIHERFRTMDDLETWSYGQSFSAGESVAYAYVHHEHGGRWHDDDFLSRAIRNREEVVSALAEILMRICGCVFPLASN